MKAAKHSHQRTYILVFLALILLTGITVGVSYLHLMAAMAIGVAMVIATTKGAFVAAYFMHLKGEHKLIYMILALTVVFFLVLLLVPLLVVTTDYRVH